MVNNEVDREEAVKARKKEIMDNEVRNGGGWW